MLILWHEFMHVVASGLVGIEAHITSRMSVSAARPHPFGLWGAYPLEIRSHLILAVILSHRKAWWLAGAPFGFAAGRYLYALASHDYSIIAERVFGPEAPERFLGMFVVIVLPVLVFVGVHVVRRLAARYRAEAGADSTPAVKA